MSLYIFDMGEVLLLGVKTLKRISEEYGLDYKDFRADYACYDMPLMDGFMNSDDYYRHLELRYNIKISGDPFQKYFDPKLNYPILNLIDMLRDRGDRAVVGSNTFKPHWDYMKVAYPELPKHFDALYASHEIHMAKPFTAFWRIILDCEGFDAKDAYFIDDKKENCDAARSIGIKSFEYSQNNEDLKGFLAL